MPSTSEDSILINNAVKKIRFLENKVHNLTDQLRLKESLENEVRKLTDPLWLKESQKNELTDQLRLKDPLLLKLWT